MTSHSTSQPSPFFWQTCSQDELESSQHILKLILEKNTQELVGIFYNYFLHHDEAAKYLNNAVVDKHLKHALYQWLLELFDFDPRQDMEKFNARQIMVGEVHARMGIPNILVLEGASLLKTKIALRVCEEDYGLEQSTQALIMLDEIIDYAMRQMSEAYVTGIKKRAQSDEALRIISLGQDINLVRETQRAALMEWAQSTVFMLFTGKSNANYQSLASSPFGLWVRHRAPLMFRPDYLLHDINNLINIIDDQIMPSIQNAELHTKDEIFENVSCLQKKIDELKFVLNDLFQKAADYESGRDPLTRTMNRRFMPSVLQREIALAQQNDTQLCVLMLDIDHFKNINDTYGHQAGDAALVKIAEVLNETIRSNDYLFRYGGEEFLIILPETNIQNGIAISTRICKVIEQTPIILPDGAVTHATISIGIAAYDGHPDYQFLLSRADEALYLAKEKGRNRVVAQSRTSIIH